MGKEETPGIAASTGSSEAGPSYQSQPSLTPETRQSTVEISASRLAEIESRLEMLTAAIKSTRTLEAASKSAPNTRDDQPASEEPSTAVKPTEMGTSDVGRFSLQGNGRARFVEGPFWANICDEATAIDELLREQTRYAGVAASSNVQTPNDPVDIVSGLPELIATTSISRNMMFPFGDMLTALDDWGTGPPQSSRFQRPMPDVIAELPPKVLCDYLFDCFVLYYHPIAPTVHIPSTRSNYQAFWDSDSQLRRTKLAQYTPLITAILFAGACACDESVMMQLSDRSREEIITSLHLLTAKILRYANFPRTPTIESFAAFLIIQNTCMREEQPLTCCSYVGTAVRVAQMLGCNHDPSRLSSMTPITAEVRRRIGWQVFYLDAMIALAAGLPSLIDLQTWSVRTVSELKEELIGTAEGIAYDEEVRSGTREPDHSGKEDSFVSTSGIFYAGKYRAATVTRNILRKLYEESAVTGRTVIEVENELEALKVDILSRRDRIPRSSLTDSQGPDRVLAKWTRLLLSALADRGWTYLYYPISYATEQRKWEETLERVLQHSRTYLEKMIALTSSEDFGPLQWSWPGIHQPLHSVMVLLRHVNKNPNSPNSGAYRQAIDEALALCGPDGGMIGVHDGRLNHRPLREGGQEVWGLIRRLRTQAWTKAGLDPDTLLTRDEVVERVRLRMAEGDEYDVWSSEPRPDTQEDLHINLDDDDLMRDLEPSAMLDINMDWLQWD